MSTTRGRLVQVNQVVIDQADYFLLDGFTRVTGLTFGDVVSQLFFNNAAQPWPLANGLGVTDIQATSGRIYFHEVPGSPGIYSVRFRPNAIGYWRLLVTYVPGTQIMAQDYDVIPQTPMSAPGITSSFIKPCS